MVDWAAPVTEFGDFEQQQCDVWNRVRNMVATWNGVETAPAAISLELVVELYFLSFLTSNGLCGLAQDEFSKRIEPVLERLLTPAQLTDLRQLQCRVKELHELIERKRELEESDRLIADAGPEGIGDILMRLADGV